MTTSWPFRRSDMSSSSSASRSVNASSSASAPKRKGFMPRRAYHLVCLDALCKDALRREASALVQREFDGVVERERAPLGPHRLRLGAELLARRAKEAHSEGLPEGHGDRDAQGLVQCLDRAGQAEGALGIAVPRRRHRHTFDLEARLDDVPERNRRAQALAVAHLRLLRIAAHERAVGEEVVREVLGARIPGRALEKLARERLRALAVASSS